MAILSSLRITNIDQYHQTYAQSQSNPESFWKKIAETFRWHRPFSQTTNGGFKQLDMQWFPDGELNITENCLDRHLVHDRDKIAIHFVSNDPHRQIISLTYQELHKEVCAAANMLKSLGVHKGDVVCLYMGMTPELMIGVLACARIGAIHSVVFGGFSAHSLAGRINDCQAKVVLTSDGVLRGDKIIALKDICDEALQTCPTIRKVLVHQRANNNISMQSERDVWWHQLRPTVSEHCSPEYVSAEHPLFILYTSGSTGKPKGLLHTTAGYMVWAAYTFDNVFQMQPNDLFWCTADLGWITGHTYTTYGPLLNGQTTVVFEGVPTYPNAGRFWDIIDQLQVTHFYTAPTAIRALMAQGPKFTEGKNLSSLKVLGSVGEPINEEAWEWYHKNIGKGRCPIVDTWWQTETGGIMISPLAHITPLIPAHATLPLPGVFPVLMDANGKKMDWKPGQELSGNLCIERPWPGMARTIFGDAQRFKETYFGAYPDHYFTGDGAKKDGQGNFRITGRVDDVVNVSGHRIGTAEVECAINKHHLIAESAVVGAPHAIKGQALYAYAIPRDKKYLDPTFFKEMYTEVNQLLTEEIGAIAKVDFLQLVSDLPKTRSGKIMRRILRKVAEGELNQLGDTSTLLNPQIVEELKAGRKG